jgi:hypothetical protein
MTPSSGVARCNHHGMSTWFVAVLISIYIHTMDIPWWLQRANPDDGVIMYAETCRVWKWLSAVIGNCIYIVKMHGINNIKFIYYVESNYIKTCQKRSNSVNYYLALIDQWRFIILLSKYDNLWDPTKQKQDRVLCFAFIYLLFKYCIKLARRWKTFDRNKQLLYKYRCVCLTNCKCC